MEIAAKAKLVNADQTGFIKGRYIGKNRRLISDIMNYTKLEHGHTHSANQCPAFRCSIFHKLS